jgi:hypothetical protein
MNKAATVNATLSRCIGEIFVMSAADKEAIYGETQDDTRWSDFGNGVDLGGVLSAPAPVLSEP